MTALTIWQADDRCPGCGTLLREQIAADGLITQECGCGWSVTWQPDTWATDQTGGDQ